MTLPTHHPYFFTCPSCGCKLISVSSGVRAKPHCPECDYFADDAFVVKDRVVNEAMNVIADNAELAENFAETVKNEIASDDDAYAHIGFHLANDIRRLRLSPSENNHSKKGEQKMFNNLNLSNALALIDKPVWVITEVRGRNKNNRTYSKSRSKNVIYPATITNVQVWRGYSHSKGDTGCPKCTVTVDIATKDDTGTEIYFDLPNELLNVTVFESKEDAEKELAYLNSNKNTMTYSEQRQREDKNNAKVFGIA